MAASSSTANNDKFSIVLGAGSYGIVLYPALTNTRSNGKTPMKHPFMATKLFYTKEDYDDAFRKYHALRTKIPHIIYEMTPYRRSFSTRNFEKNTEFMKEYKEAFFGDTPLPPHPMPLYAAAIPYLGSDLYRIISDPSRIARFLRIPEKDIVRELYNLFYKVKQIRDAGLLHGDIKTDNIVFNFGTKHFNLIDTDSITTWGEFKKGHPTIKSSEYYPPEYYIVAAGPEKLERAYRGSNDRVVERNLLAYTADYYKELQPTYNIFGHLPDILKINLALNRIDIQLASELYMIRLDGPRIGTKTVAEKFDMIETISKNGFDSYCLSLTLFLFFNHVRSKGGAKKYEYLTNTILADGISRYFYSKRSNLDTILLQLKNLARSEHGLSLYPPLPRSRTRSKSRSGSSNTRRSSRGS